MQVIEKNILSRINLFQTDIFRLRRNPEFKIEQARYNLYVGGKEVNLFSLETVMGASESNLIFAPYFNTCFKQDLFNINFVFGKRILEYSSGEFWIMIVEPLYKSSGKQQHTLFELDCELLIYRTNNALKNWYIDHDRANAIGRKRIVKALGFLKSLNHKLESNMPDLAKTYLICSLLNKSTLMKYVLSHIISGISGWHENREWLGPMLTGNTESWSLPPICKEFDFNAEYNATKCFAEIFDQFESVLARITFSLEFHEKGYVNADSDMLITSALKEIRNLLKSSFTGRHSFLNKEMLDFAIKQNPACIQELRSLSEQLNQKQTN